MKAFLAEWLNRTESARDGKVVVLADMPDTAPASLAEDFVSSGTSQKYTHGRNVGVFYEYRLSLKLSSDMPRVVPRLIKPPTRRKSKRWTNAPYYPASVAATCDDMGRVDRRAVDSFYAALALRGGHTVEEVAAMLQLVSPAASSRPDYCEMVVKWVQKNLPAHLLTEKLERYVEAHPFKWELGLSVTKLACADVVPMPEKR